MPELAPQPAFVLVGPQMGENIGAAARAMWNFGLDRMRIVAPRDGWPNSRAVAMASGAGRLLDQAMVTDDLDAAIADAHFVLATTARPRDLTKTVFTPKEAMREARTRIAAGQRVAVLFGRERTGLENPEIARASAIVSVPVNPAFPSLNLAQCVLLMAYEWHLGADGTPPRAEALAGTDWATRDDVEHLARNWEQALDEAGFFFPPHKAEVMKLNLRNLWSRMPFTRADVHTLQGALRQLLRKRRAGGGQGG